MYKYVPLYLELQFNQTTVTCGNITYELIMQKRIFLLQIKSVLI